MSVADNNYNWNKYSYPTYVLFVFINNVYILFKLIN